jgi:S1-C subfamily serine protease/DNA-binding response OmpR family regulator
MRGEFTAMRILLLNLGSESTRAVQQALSGQGYEVVAEHDLTIDEILKRTSELLITEATPSNLSCCGLISQIKASSDFRALKVVMIVHGDALERARGLDLGADDVVSFPFEPLEFSAKIRVQFRQRQPELKLEVELKDALEREHLAESAVGTLIGVAMSRRRFWVISLVCTLSAATVLAALTTVISDRRSRKDTLQLKADVARLNGGVLRQQELLRRTGQDHDSQSGGNAPETRESLQAQSAAIRKQTATQGGADNESLKRQVQETQSQLKLLENESRAAEAIVHKYGPSVCLLHVVVELKDKPSGKIIRIAVDPSGKPLVDDKGTMSLQTEGKGPPLQFDFFGTGFLVASDGRVLTNHHVVEPWWGDKDLQELTDAGAEAFALSYMAYFPGVSQGMAAKVDRISELADLATLKLQSPTPPEAAALELDDRSEASVTGDPVILIGYPTGIEGILARADGDVTRQLAANAHNVTDIVSQLAAQRLIRPTITQGHIGDVVKGEIVYDAATTAGGSGGPLFNHDGKVIGVNAAILKDFGGSNMAIPARYADELLK